MIIPHADILFGLFILFRWDVDCGVITVSKTPGDKRSIALIRLDLFSASLLGHRCRGKDDAFDIVLCQLVIERETEASCLIAAYEHDIVTVLKMRMPQKFQIQTCSVYGFEIYCFVKKMRMPQKFHRGINRCITKDANTWIR